MSDSSGFAVGDFSSSIPPFVGAEPEIIKQTIDYQSASDIAPLSLVQVDHETVAVKYGTVLWDVPTIGGKELSEDSIFDNSITISGYREVYLYISQASNTSTPYWYWYWYWSSSNYDTVVEIRTAAKYEPIVGEGIATILLGVVEWGDGGITGVASNLSGNQWVEWCGNLTLWTRY